MTTTGATAPATNCVFPLPTRPTLTLLHGGDRRPPTGGGPPTGPLDQSERRLLTAILEDAVLIVRRDAHRQAPGNRRLLRETRDWFLADDPCWPFSCVNVCEALGVDVMKLRAALSPFLDTPLPGPFTGPGGW
jgi:hypothetical protein